MPRHPRNPSRILSRPARGAFQPSASIEDYLERIGELTERHGSVRMVEIAHTLQVSRPSVTAMVKRLADAGYVDYEKYRGLVLTAKGRAVAAQMRVRHATLKRFLAVLGSDEQTQEDEIEGWEHCLSANTLDCIARLTRFMEADPELLRAFRQRLDD